LEPRDFRPERPPHPAPASQDAFQPTDSARGQRLAGREARVSMSAMIARGTLRLLFGQLASRLVEFALYLLLARRLGVEGFGLYMFAFSFTLLFSVLADCGVSTVLTREVARAPERTRALLGDVLRIKIVLGVVALAAVLAVAALTGQPRSSMVFIGLFTLGMLIHSAAAVFEALLRADGRNGAAGLSQVWASIANLAAAALLIADHGATRVAGAPGFGVWAGALAYAISGMVHFLAAVWPARHLWHARAQAPTAAAALARATAATRWTARVAMLREAAPLAISGVFIALYFRIDSVMLHAMIGERAVGLFGGIYRVFEVLALIAVSFRSVLFPIMARVADGPREALAALTRKSLRVHLLFTVVVAVFFTVEARPIVSLVLGPGYEDAAPGLAVLIWALPGSYMADTLIHLLIAKRQQLAASWAVGLVGLFNVALNLVVIPRWSFTGAAAATVVSEVLCFVLLFASFRRDVPGVSFARVAVAPLAAGAVTGGALLLVTPWLPPGPWGLAIAAFASLAGYAGVLSLLRAIGREDLALLRDLLLPRRAP